MKVKFSDYEDAFTQAEQCIREQCSGYNLVCSSDVRGSVPNEVYVKLVSVFWEEYHNCWASVNDMHLYINFHRDADFTAFLLRWS